MEKKSMQQALRFSMDIDPEKLLTQMDVTPFLELEAVNEWDKVKLMDIKRAILTNFPH
jgi:hypothetical protein